MLTARHEWLQCARNSWSMSIVSEFKVADAFCCRPGSYGVFVSSWGVGGAVDCLAAGQSSGTGVAMGIAAPSQSSTCTTATSERSSIATAGGATTSSIASRTSAPNGGVDPNADISPAPSPSLTKGAIAGIVIGCVIGVSIIAAGAWWIGRHRAANKYNHEPRPPPPTDHAAYTANTWVVAHTPTPVTSVMPVSEMAGETRGRSKPQELPAQT